MFMGIKVDNKYSRQILPHLVQGFKQLTKRGKLSLPTTDRGINDSAIKKTNAVVLTDKEALYHILSLKHTL